MLKKLLKYEIPAVARKLLPLYAAWLAVSVVLGLSIRSEDRSPESFIALAGILYGAVTTAIVVMNFIILVQRYDRHLLGDGGYFSLVLPVKMRTHIMNKTISAGFWVIVAAFAGLLSGILITLAAGQLDVLDAIRDLFSIEPGIFLKLLLTFINMLVLIFLGGGRFGLMVYSALTLGRQLKKHNSLGSIFAFIAIILFEYLVSRVLYHTGVFHVLANIQGSGFVQGNLVILLMSVIQIALGAIYFAICNYLMTSRLNLN